MDETNIIQIINADDVCRACLSEGELQPIFMTRLEESHLTLSEMLMACTSVKASEEDGLPSKMCFSCIEQMKQAFSFKRQCEETDANLRLYLTNRISTKWGNSLTDRAKKEIMDEHHSDELNDVDNENTVEYDIFSNLNEMSSNENNSDNQQKDSIVQIARRKKDKKTRRSRTAGVRKNNNECEKCNLQFDTRSEYLLHARSKRHQGRWYPCSVCNKKFTGYRLKEHMRTHTKEKPISCDICGVKFSLDCNLRRHMKIHTGERPHKCHVCAKEFIRATALVLHLRTHTGEKPFVCSTCGKKYSQSYPFKCHLRKHEPTNGENYELPTCKICNKTFTTNVIMKAHVMQVHEPRKFLCNLCGKDFATKKALLVHMNIHTGEKPFSCKTCGKSFRQTSGLKAHEVIHTGERPYVCEICDKPFTQINHLKYHARVHTGEKPYTCSVCNKSFSLNGTLTVHMRTHTGETPYLCPVCGKGFYDSSSMKRHCKKHKIEDNLKIKCKS